MGDAFKEAEVAVVKTKAASQFPNSLDRVEFRTVGRQEIESERRRLLLAPWTVESGMVIAGVVADGHHAPTGTSAGRMRNYL